MDEDFDFDISIDESFQALTDSYEEGYDADELFENIDKFISMEGQVGIDMLAQYALQTQAFDIIDVLDRLGVNVVNAILDVLGSNDFDVEPLLVNALGENQQHLFETLVDLGATAPRASILRAAELGGTLKGGDPEFIARVYELWDAQPKDVVRLMIALDDWSTHMNDGKLAPDHVRLLRLVNDRVGLDVDQHARLLLDLPIEDRIGYRRRYLRVLPRPEYGATIPVQRAWIFWPALNKWVITKRF